MIYYNVFNYIYIIKNINFFFFKYFKIEYNYNIFVIIISNNYNIRGHALGFYTCDIRICYVYVHSKIRRSV